MAGTASCTFDLERVIIGRSVALRMIFSACDDNFFLKIISFSADYGFICFLFF